MMKKLLGTVFFVACLSLCSCRATAGMWNGEHNSNSDAQVAIRFLAPLWLPITIPVDICWDVEDVLTGRFFIAVYKKLFS